MINMLVENSRPSERILILMLAGIGDLVLASPAVKSIEQHFGVGNTLLAVVPRALPIVPLLGIRSQVITLDLNRVRWPRSLFSRASRMIISTFERDVATYSPDIVVNLHEIGSLRGLLSVWFLLRNLRVGNSVGRGYRNTILPYTRGMPEQSMAGNHNVIRYCRTATVMGVPPLKAPAPEFVFKSTPEGPVILPQPYLCINPGGYTSWKRWPASRFADVGRALLDQKLGIVILGSASEVATSRKIAEIIGPRAFSLAGELDLPGLVKIISGAEMLITNNSGPMHIAAAAGVPTIALFGNLPVRTLHPWLPETRYRVLSGSLKVPNAVLRNILLPLSLRSISTARVLSAVQELKSEQGKTF